MQSEAEQGDAHVNQRSMWHTSRAGGPRRAIIGTLDLIFKLACNLEAHLLNV